MINNCWRWSLLSEIVTVEEIERSPEDFAFSLLVYEQLLSRLAQAFVVCGAVRRCRGGRGVGVYPIGFPIRRYDSALKSCQPTSAAQRPDSSVQITIKTLATTSSLRPVKSENATSRGDHQVALKVPHRVLRVGLKGGWGFQCKRALQCRHTMLLLWMRR